MKRWITAFLAASAIAAPACADSGKKVFFLLSNSTTIRFESRDAPFFVEAMKNLAPNVQVMVQNAQGDPARQQRLVEDAITQGAPPPEAERQR
jgi:D-xylose transport system substrate-binding protein